jgi:hypothetical protein
VDGSHIDAKGGGIAAWSPGNARILAAGRGASRSRRRVAVAQVGQRKQRLAGRARSAAMGSPLPAVGADPVGEVVQRSGGQRDLGRVRQQRGSPEGALSWSIACLTGSLTTPRNTPKTRMGTAFPEAGEVLLAR